MPLSLISAVVLKLRPAGVTTDFCPVCRQERRCRLAIAENRRIVLLMDKGQVGHEHHELTCMSCQCKMERPIEERPIKNVPEGPAAETFEPELLPIVTSRIRSCSKMELARREERLDAEGREEMIRHCLYSFARIYDEEPTARITPATSGMLFVASLLLVGGAIYAFTQTEQGWIGFGCVGGVLGLWIGLWYWVVTHSPRKKVRTWLAMSLAPLNPTIEEIRAIRRELQAGRINAGFKIRSAKVIAKIEKLKSSGLVPG